MAKKISAILMAFALVWLTISLPFVYRAMNQATYAVSGGQSGDQGAEEDLPLNATEEKSPVNNGAQEEYLHDSENDHALSSLFLTHTSKQVDRNYLAFHGELLSPPPEWHS